MLFVGFNTFFFIFYIPIEVENRANTLAMRYCFAQHRAETRTVIRLLLIVFGGLEDCQSTGLHS